MMKKIILFGFVMVSIISCVDKSSPEFAAEKYLTALKNKDWETAKKYSSDEMDDMLDMMRRDGNDFHITKIKDIKCREEKYLNCYVCTFCCMEDSSWYIFLDKDKHGNWQSCHRKHIPGSI